MFPTALGCIFFSFGISCMLTSLTFGLSALCDCVEAEYEFRISARVCVCASVCLCVRGTYPHEWRTKFHINQKRNMANHRIKDLSALKVASCPTNFEKLLLAHQELSFHPETACLWLRPFRGTLLLSKSFLSFHPISSLLLLVFYPHTNNEQTKIKPDMWPTL